MIRQKKILIIDDDDGLRAVIKLSLKTVAGWEVITAASGKEGLILAEKLQPDAILLDMILPEMNGQEIWQKLAENPATKQIPVIFLTASDDLQEVKELLPGKRIKAIAKPFTPNELVSQIRKILYGKD